MFLTRLIGFVFPQGTSRVLARELSLTPLRICCSDDPIVNLTVPI